MILPETFMCESEEGPVVCVINALLLRKDIIISKSEYLICSDQCVGDVTLSFWVRPLNMESDQVFIKSSASTNDQTYESFKVEFVVEQNSYQIKILRNRVLYMKHFWMELNQWSHVVVQIIIKNIADIHVYVNGQMSSGSLTLDSMSSEPVVPGLWSQMTVGVRGHFDVDDIRCIQSTVRPSAFYGECFKENNIQKT